MIKSMLIVMSVIVSLSMLTFVLIIKHGLTKKAKILK